MSNRNFLLQFINEVVDQELSKHLRPKRGMLESLTLFFEDRMSDAQKKYPEIAPWLNQAFQSVDQKYIPWVAKNLATDKTQGVELDSEDLFHLRDVVLKFDQASKTNRIQKKDIHAYKDFTDLESNLSSVNLDSSKTKEKKQAKGNHKLIWRDARYTIIQPLDMAASCAYGSGTKWCISATQSQNYFHSYADKGVTFYFIIDKTPEFPQYQKVALAVYPGGNKFEIFDATDGPLSLDEFLQIYPKPVFDALNPFVNDQFHTVAEQVAGLREKLFAAKTPKELARVASQVLAPFENGLDYPEDGENGEGENLVTQVFREAIQNIPLNLLPALYSIGGYSLTNMGLMDDMVARLTKENPTLDQLEQMIKTSASTVGIYALENDGMLGADPYAEYLNSRPLTEQEMYQLVHMYISPKRTSTYGPYASIAFNQYTAQLYKQMGFPENDHEFEMVFRNYVLSTHFQKEVKEMADALTAGNQKLLNILWSRHEQHSSAEWKDVKRLIDLYQAGKINSGMIDVLKVGKSTEPVDFMSMLNQGQ